MARLIALGVAGILLLILLFQNLAGVPIRFFFWGFTMPGAVVFLLTLVAGGLVGFAVATALGRGNTRRRR